MHQLLLLRHAKSSWANEGAADRDRPLNGRGRRAAATLRRAMVDLGLAPDLILVSPSARTLETMRALEPWDDTPLVEPREELYLANKAKLLATLCGVAETVRGVLLIGHNPGLHDLAIDLTDMHGSNRRFVDAVRDGFPTGALAEFSVAGPWSRLQSGANRLIRFVTPRMLEEAD
jgi:phosphohistidine phosphatase